MFEEHPITLDLTQPTVNKHRGVEKEVHFVYIS